MFQGLSAALPGSLWRTLGVAEEVIGFVRGGEGQVCQLEVLAMTTASATSWPAALRVPELGVQVVGPFAGSPRSVPELGADRATGVLNPSFWSQYAGSVSPTARNRWDEATFAPTTVVSTRIRLQRSTFVGCREQRLRRLPRAAPRLPAASARSAPGGRLHQCGLVGHRLVQCDAADTSAAGLASYRAALEDSFLMNDLKALRRFPRLMEVTPRCAGRTEGGPRLHARTVPVGGERTRVGRDEVPLS